MSGRIGNRIIEIPSGVTVKINPDSIVVSGPRGTLEQKYDPAIKITQEGSGIKLISESSDNRLKARHGLYNSLIKNMVEGVSKGFEKVLELSGVGYRAALSGKKLAIQLGYSHPIEIDPPPDIKFEIEGPRIKISGPDRQRVGEVAAEIRELRKVEPYKGKGIRYFGEKVRRKAGKVVKTAGATAA